MLVDQDGYFVGKVIALGAGMSEEPGGLNVSRACGSATQAIVSDVEQIRTGHSPVALAGGTRTPRMLLPVELL